MKKQILLLALLLFGAVYFSSFNTNGVNACDKTCRAAYFNVEKLTVKNTAAKNISADYEEDQFDQVRPVQFPFSIL